MIGFRLFILTSLLSITQAKISTAKDSSDENRDSDFSNETMIPGFESNTGTLVSNNGPVSEAVASSSTTQAPTNLPATIPPKHKNSQNSRRQQSRTNNRPFRNRRFRRQNQGSRKFGGMNRRGMRMGSRSFPVTSSPVTPAPTRPAATSPTPRPTSHSTPWPIPTPTGDEANEWLTAHNVRRQQFHTNNEFMNRTYVPLKWSPGLQASAQKYSESLIAESERRGRCYIAHGHNGDSYGGENLAANWGRRSIPPSPASAEWILSRWFEDEEFLDPLDSFHRTQVAWAGTKYVGCGAAGKLIDGIYCEIQTCRYLAPGNCNVGAVGSNRTALYNLVLADSSPCRPQCPVGGCD